MRSLLKLARALSAKGVMGMNMRNHHYVMRYNKRSLYPLVDNKLETKRLADANQIAVPKLYHAIEIEHQAQQLGNLLNGFDDFVVKPANGSGGDGILVIAGRSELSDGFLKSNGILIDLNQLQHHVSNILSGMYSLGGQADVAMIEQRVDFDPVFEKITYQGVPDVRVIVLLGVPVMAMVRLPTRQSDGKANLHQGAIGAGIELATGLTLQGVWFNNIITKHPDTQHAIANLEIPHWDTILHLAARCCDMTGLGYLGVDVVLDKTRGPLILELNARPGMNIQIANQSGLLQRCRHVEQNRDRLVRLDQRLAFAKQQF